MIRTTALPCLFILISALAADAESNFAPTFGDQAEMCPDQPDEPQWMRELPVRDAHKRLLVQQIYRAESMQRIVDAQDCGCPTRYPPWDAVEALYFEGYAAAEYREVLEVTSAHRRKANALRLAAMAICRAAGNW
ncbi:hypothetical protein [Oceanicola sp. 502str15]|uniref:hypothetical protein n=1 Tax=Oceanicola sp. 502str15 TaxID=2696061 RepID=UPI0020950351|nr:hypothetical protein [Oceanicola sp. 502str15]MCO6385265.1 hypothetical protein [Oceanicola sp. 502str15]